MKSLLLVTVFLGLLFSIFLTSSTVSGASFQISANPCPYNYTGPTPNPDDCHSFYLCIGGHGSLTQCPADLCYNSETIQCDYCDFVPGCEIGGGTPRPPPSTTTPTPTTSTRGTTSRPSPTTTEPTTPLPFPCPPNVEYMKLPFPNDCRKYYVCINGNHQGTYLCRDGLWFHFQQQECAYPWDDMCS